MGILSDREILKLSGSIISPFEPKQRTTTRTFLDRDGRDYPCISYGLSSYGYDLRLDRVFKVFHPIDAHIVDVKQLTGAEWVDREVDGHFDMSPHSYILGTTVEWVKVPRGCLGLVVGKSTYARCGLHVNTTPLEPEWEGNITLELQNCLPLPLRLYPMEGICQVVFFSGKEPVTSYADRKGKYQGQVGVVGARV